MKTFYLIAYNADYPRNAHVFPRADVRKIEATSAKKAEPLREAYERELNGGELWSSQYVADRCNEGKESDRRYVYLMAFTEAREFRDFNSWPCNNEEAGYEEDLTETFVRALRHAESVLSDYASSDTGAKGALNEVREAIQKAEQQFATA